MSKPYSINELRIGFSKTFDEVNRDAILENNTYLFDKHSIKGVKVVLELYGGKSVILDLEEILDWEVELDDIYIDDKVLDQ